MPKEISLGKHGDARLIFDARVHVQQKNVILAWSTIRARVVIIVMNVLVLHIHGTV